ncbi:hypothetical protein [Larkinella rosea]|uniref:Uncharacterized protein n=1 Tax=Larkinella rosea TaxID=2025312 RepID=A0A3P1C3Z6_9BACT|nr:hypothetical protein [Larkinella rosea]RRB07766.1 hypothetical protein EHT25_08325 [Larkinella rosea]
MITKDTIRKVSKLLKLSSTGDEQDWAIEYADETRIADFLKTLQTYTLSSAEKIAIVSLILASYDEYLATNIDHSNEIWNQIKPILDSDKLQYQNLLIYWAVFDEKNEGNLFNITPLVRDYLIA